MLILLQTAPAHLRSSGSAADPGCDVPRTGAGELPDTVPTSLDEPRSPKPARERTDWLRLLVECFGDE